MFDLIHILYSIYVDNCVWHDSVLTFLMVRNLKFRYPVFHICVVLILSHAKQTSFNKMTSAHIWFYVFSFP